MDYIEYGASKTRASKLMLGMWRFADETPEHVAELVETCLDCGANALDTADVYGRGHCEELLGEAFALRPGIRDQVFLQTKVGIREEPHTWFDFSTAPRTMPSCATAA